MFEPRTLYIPGNSFLHRLHPLTKLVFTLSAVLVVFLGPGGGWSAGVVGLICLAMAGWAGLLRPALRGLRVLLPLLVVLLVVHGLYNPANQSVLWSRGPLVFYQEGVAYALLVAGRLAAALLASLLTVFSTTPADLMRALAEAGLHPKLVYLLGSPLLLLPQMSARAASIQVAQQARGLETGGSFAGRVRALLPLIAPLVYSALIDVEERSLALEARAFSAGGRRTSLVELRDTRVQQLARRGMVALALALAAFSQAWRLLGGA